MELFASLLSNEEGRYSEGTERDNDLMVAAFSLSSGTMLFGIGKVDDESEANLANCSIDG